MRLVYSVLRTSTPYFTVRRLPMEVIVAIHHYNLQTQSIQGKAHLIKGAYDAFPISIGYCLSVPESFSSQTHNQSSPSPPMPKYNCKSSTCSYDQLLITSTRTNSRQWLVWHTSATPVPIYLSDGNPCPPSMRQSLFLHTTKRLLQLKTLALAEGFFPSLSQSVGVRLHRSTPALY